MKRKLLSLGCASAALALLCGCVPLQMADSTLRESSFFESMADAFARKMVEYAENAESVETVELVRRTYTTAETITRVEVEDNNAPIEIRTGTGDKVTVEYGEPEDQSFYTISVRGGTLSVERLERKLGGVRLTGDDTLVITLPEKEYASIEADTDNGSLKVENLSARQMELGSDNGDIETKNVTAQSLSAETDNGTARLTDTTAQYLEAQSDNGEIVLERTTADVYDCETDNGSITGTLNGSAEEYSIQVSKKNGSSNLSSRTLAGAKKSIRFQTDNGDIQVEFAG